MNSSDYNNRDKLVAMFKNYYLLEDLGNGGDQVAICIKLDLLGMLGKGCNCGFVTPLTDVEGSILQDYFIYGFTQQELSEKYRVSQMAISNKVVRAMDKLIDFWEVYGE